MVTDPAISAPRPGRLSNRCPAPGISHARRMAENHLEDEGDVAGVVDGLVAGVGDGTGVTGKAAPGLSLTNSFYPIGVRSFDAWSPQPDPHACTGARGSRYPERAAGVGVEQFELLVVDFHSVLGSGGQAQHK